MRLTHVCLAVLFHKLYAGQLFKFFFLLFINEKERQFTSATQNWALFRHLFLTGSRSLSLSVQFPTTVFVYIQRNQSSNQSTGNKGPIGKNKGPGSENVHSSEFEILALYTGGGGAARVRSVSTLRVGSATPGLVVYTVATPGLGVCCRSLWHSSGFLTHKSIPKTSYRDQKVSYAERNISVNTRKKK